MPVAYLTRDLLIELAGTKCHCGSNKKAQEAFCRDCFFALPTDLRTGLYHTGRKAYAVAYAAAREFLEGRTKS